MREQTREQQEQKQEGSTTKAFASLTNQPQEPEPSRDATVRPSGRAAMLMLTGAVAALSGGYGYTRRPRADEQYGVSPRERVLDYWGVKRLAAAEAKRARKAAKRRRSA